MSHWLTIVLFFLPAGVANATPVVANRIPLLNRWKTPLDFGLSLGGQRVLGNNKTWRGLVTGTIFAGLTGLLLQPVLQHDSPSQAFVVSLAMGFGALFGDAVESYLKRRRGIQSGHSWFPFDQIDYIIGGLLFAAPFTSLSLKDCGLIFITYFTLHLLVAYSAYLVGLKDKPI